MKFKIKSKFKIQNSKSQTNPKSEIQNPRPEDSTGKSATATNFQGGFENFEFGVLNLFGIWGFEF